MADRLKLGVAGALGRMGRQVEAMAAAREDMLVAARFDRAGAAGEGLVSRAEALSTCDVIIDFSVASAAADLAREAAKTGRCRLVIGATGFTPEEEAAVAEAAKSVAIVKSGNFSLGLNVLIGLVRQAAAALPMADFDLEVFEAHHKRKIDAPSGTALMLGAAGAEGRGQDLAEVAVRVRDGVTGPREPGSIGFSVVRGGGIVGEHSVVLAGEEEILTLSHSARDRALFARGAVAAAGWIAAKLPGLYSMQDVLGF
jgi:4-hydroxy-tetrahydrodipicolinate reductase